MCLDKRYTVSSKHKAVKKKEVKATPSRAKPRPKVRYAIDILGLIGEVTQSMRDTYRTLTRAKADLYPMDVIRLAAQDMNRAYKEGRKIGTPYGYLIERLRARQGKALLEKHNRMKKEQPAGGAYDAVMKRKGGGGA